MSRSSPKNENSGETWETRSSPLGLYAFYRLPNGIYTIRVSLFPLSFLKTGVKVLPGQKSAARHQAAHRSR